MLCVMLQHGGDTLGFVLEQGDSIELISQGVSIKHQHIMTG